MSKNWVNFNELREQLRFEQVLEHYGVELTPTQHGKGAQLGGPCCLPLCHSLSEGSKRRTLSVSCETKVFLCHRCKSKGSILDFVALMEGADPLDGQAFRAAVLTAAGKFLELGALEAKQMEAEPATATAGRVQERTEEPEIINAPLDFALKLEATHPWFAKRGLKPETVKEFGLGYAARGLLKGRIAIPLHDLTGNLAGYAGRLVDETNKDEPLFKFPDPRRVRDGTALVFEKDLLLYGGYRLHIGERLSELVLVQGFADCWRLYQDGVEAVVAAMGDCLSAVQADQIVGLVKPDKGRVWIVPDATEAGRAFAENAMERLVTRCFCQWVQLPEGESPARCSWEKILDRMPRS